MHTDDWAAYRRVNTLPNVAAHRVVVHARHFVDPRTGVHTQEAESSWSSLKLGQTRRKGLRKEDWLDWVDLDWLDWIDLDWLNWIDLDWLLAGLD